MGGERYIPFITICIMSMYNRKKLTRQYFKNCSMMVHGKNAARLSFLPHSRGVGAKAGGTFSFPDVWCFCLHRIMAHPDLFSGLNNFTIFTYLSGEVWKQNRQEGPM